MLMLRQFRTAFLKNEGAEDLVKALRKRNKRTRLRRAKRKAAKRKAEKA